MDEINKKLCEKYGIEHEILKVLEELNELSLEIFKNINKKSNNLLELIDEISDVYIQLKKLLYIYKIPEKTIKNHIEFKKQLIKDKYL